jgi:predicted transcriptional regulator
VDSLTASNYGSVKGQVSENIENQLVPQEITNIYNNFLNIQNLENELDRLAIQLEQNNIIISNKYKNIHNQSMNDKQSIGLMLNQLGDEMFDPKEMNSINNILSDSSIVLTQKNYSYIIWSIVAVTLVLVTMSVIRK